MTKPLAVLISDIHFTIPNIELASESLSAAIDCANDLDVPLVIAGDLNDSKDIIRAKVANRLIELLKRAQTDVILMVGNHDLINEKGKEHGLNYLAPYVVIAEQCGTTSILGENVGIFPYQSSSEELKEKLSRVPKGSILIMHQGFLGASMGDYVQDKSSLDPELVKDFTVISGHYHRHQTLGTVTYIGSPYTMTFGEANDGPKGFLVLNTDGTFERKILDLRRHIKIECDIKDLYDKNLYKDVRKKDLLWLKVTGPRAELSAINKQELGLSILGHSNFKLDLDFTGDVKLKRPETSKLSDIEIFDSIIEGTTETADQKLYLKELFREIIKS